MSEPNIEELRTRLRETMTDNGFTQTDVAKIIGTSQSVLSRFLRGQGPTPTPNPDTVARIRAFLGDEEHTEVLSHEEVRKAVRLYRYVKGVTGAGGKIAVKNADGTENLLVLLW